MKYAIATVLLSLTSIAVAQSPARDLSGKWSADILREDGSAMRGGTGLFDLIVSDGPAVTGTANFFGGNPRCTGTSELTGTKGESISLSTRNGIDGCERHMALKLTGENILEGSMVAPQGTFRIKITRH